jgi:RNA polymerase sigma factor FliA
MQTQEYEPHNEQKADGTRLILEQSYKTLDQRFGRPARDEEICDEMGITLDAFHQMLDRIKGLRPGAFQRMAPRNGNDSSEPLIRFILDASDVDSSFVVRESEIREKLARAIESLPEMERLTVSLYYDDELTLKEIGAALGIDEAGISRLFTKAMLRMRSKLRE